MPYKYNPLLVGRLDRVGDGASTLGELEDVNTAGTANDKVLTFQSGTWIPAAVAGGGDMLISQYVTGAGTVYNATRLGGDPLATVQAHNVEASKITSGTLAVARHETLDNLNGTVALAQVPTMDDGHIPDLDTLSYSSAFGTAQVPSIGAYKTTTGTFGASRIPILPTNRYGSAVLLTGAQSIGGTKTFTDIPILPASNPTADNEAARKAYVDAQSGDIDGGIYSDTYVNTADIDGGTF